jgi:hypothetical protein
MVTPDPEAEALGAVEAFESVGVRNVLLLYIDDRTMANEVEPLDTTALKTKLRSCVERSRSRSESVVLRISNPDLIQVDDCDESVRARLAPFAFLTYQTSPNRYQAWLCLSDRRGHRVVRQRLLRRLASTGANGVPSGGTRMPGTRNCKPIHRRADGSCPPVTLVSVAPGRRVGTGELERAGLLAPRGAPGLAPVLRRVLPRLARVGGLTRVAAFRNRKQVLILQYRGVTEHPEYPLRLEMLGHVKADRFEAQLEYLRRRCRVLPLRVYLEAIHDGHRLPDYSVVLTFDEGHANFLTAAAPRLLAAGLPATVFVVPERLSRRDFAGERRWTSCEDERYLSWSDIASIRRQGFEIGLNLPHPATLLGSSTEGVKLALTRGYQSLIAMGAESPPLALRRGEFEPSVVQHARTLGLSCALHAADSGMNPHAANPFALRRLIFHPQSRDDPRMFASDVSGLRTWWTRLARHDQIDG